MNITIRDPETFNNTLGNSSGNYTFAFTPSNQSTPRAESSTPASGDQFQVSVETIKTSIENEKDFNISSSDNRIEQTSMKLYSNQLNTIKALNTSGKLTEMLEQVSSNDKNNSWGYSLNQILAKAKITRNGKILTSSEELLEALKNDKDGKIKESINNAITDIQGSGSFKEKLKWADDKHDGELVGAGASGATIAATTIKVGGKTLAGAALNGAGSLLTKSPGFLLANVGKLAILGNPWVSAALFVGVPLAKYALDKSGASEKIAEAWESSGVGASVNSFVSNAGDNIGYQISKLI
jgi:hypothetical protein